MKEVEKALGEALHPSKNTQCKNGLKQIGIYVTLYESKYRKYPKSLADLRSPDLANDEKLFRCAVTGKDDAYVYVFPEKGDETAYTAILAYDREPHPDGARSVLLFSGVVRTLDKDQFAQALKSGVVEEK